MTDPTVWPQPPRKDNDSAFCALCGAPETTYDRIEWSTDLAVWMCGRCEEKRREPRCQTR